VVRAFSSPAAISGKLAVALTSAVKDGLKAVVLRDAPLIEDGSIRLSDIPAVWANASPTSIEPPPARAAKESTRRGEGRLSRKYLSSKGSPLFTVKTRGDRHAVVSFQVNLDEEFFDDLKLVVEKRLRRRKT
jgi:hypothetical protein